MEICAPQDIDSGNDGVTRTGMKSRLRRASSQLCCDVSRVMLSLSMEYTTTSAYGGVIFFVGTGLKIESPIAVSG